MHAAAYMLMLLPQWPHYHIIVTCQTLHSYSICRTEVECPNWIHGSKMKLRREPNPKLLQRFLLQAELQVTTPQKSRCVVANNAVDKPTLGPFAFAREKKYCECSIRQVTSNIWTKIFVYWVLLIFFACPIAESIVFLWNASSGFFK